MGKKILLLHVFRERLNYPELRSAVIEQARVWNAQTSIIEDKGSGTQLIQELSGATFLNVLPAKAVKDKILRLNEVIGPGWNSLST